MAGADWTPEADVRLTMMWESGASAALIGLAMGRSKNSIVGRVHRLKLPARSSPIRVLPEGSVSRVKRRAERRASALVTLAPVLAAAAPPVAPRCLAIPAPPPPPSRLVVASRRAEPCCYPIGAPRTPQFRFCGATPMPGKPYCAVHHAATSVAVRPRRIDPAARDDAERLAVARRSLSGVGRFQANADGIW